MLGPLISWTVFVLFGALLSLRKMFIHRAAQAIGVAAAISLTSATWLAPSSFVEDLDVRISLALIILTFFCMAPTGKFRFPWIWLDTIIILLFLTGVFNDWLRNGGTFTTAMRVYGEFTLPYFFGRFLSMRIDGVNDSAVWLAVGGTVIGLGALIESFTETNLWELLFATKDDLVIMHDQKRYGLFHRATGPTRHPIFLGIVLMLQVPWSLAVICSKKSRRFAIFGWFALAAMLLGVMSTVSRGPILCLGLAVCTAISIRWPRMLKWFIIIACFFAILIVSFWDQAVSFVESTQAGDRVRGRVINVDGEAEIYSGTRNRLWVWEIYGPLVVKGGPLGYGTEAVSSFPPNIPGLPVSVRTRETLGIVDNSYLLIGLRYGWIGIGLFIALLTGSIFTAIQLRKSAGLVLDPDGPAFLTAMASILVGVSIEILTVFSSFDFMFWLLFHCGVVAGLASLRKDMLRGMAT